MTENQLVLFLFIVIVGVLFEAIFSKFYYRHKTAYKKHFIFARYLFLLTFPLLATITTFFLVGIKPIKVFLVFALLGPVLEWCIGFSYQTIVGQRLWTYHRYSITGNTSWLATPLWGFAGVLFYYLARVIN